MQVPRIVILVTNIMAITGYSFGNLAYLFWPYKGVVILAPAYILHNIEHAT